MFYFLEINYHDENKYMGNTLVKMLQILELYDEFVYHVITEPKELEFFKVYFITFYAHSISARAFCNDNYGALRIF